LPFRFLGSAAETETVARRFDEPHHAIVRISAPDDISGRRRTRAVPSAQRAPCPQEALDA